MRKLHSTFDFLACAVVALAFTITAQAQNNRTYVSQSGLDTNSCIETSPCRSLSRALAVTNLNGEVVVTDSGSYGAPFTITQGVTINAVGVLCSMSTVAAGSHITINTTGNVTLIGLTLHGVNAGTNGILVQQAATLRLKNVAVDGYTNDGLDVTAAGKLIIDDSSFENNGSNGLEINSGSAKVFARKSGFDQNGNDGVLVTNGTFTADLSWANFNTVAGFETENSASSYLTHVAATFNADGLYTTVTTSNVYWAYSNISANTTDLNAPAGSMSFLPGTPTQGSSLTGSQTNPTCCVQPMH